MLKRVAALHPKIIDLSLDRIVRLMAALDHPERRIGPVLHVAGTNGKGSVLAFLRAILEAAGLTVNVYTSPHLVRFAERIRLRSRLIEEARLQDLLEACERANAGQPITFFEITTAAAFLAFAEQPADLTLLETGLGGRLDATNIIDRPRLTLITPISFDHMQYLGTTLAAIAFEKAGILKPGAPCLIAPQQDAAAQVLAHRAREVGAPTLWAGRDWQARSDEKHMHWSDNQRQLVLPLPALAGAHQIENAALALAAAASLTEFAIPDAAMAKGMTTVEWPARLQRLRRGPLPDGAPEGSEVWLDGAHNPAGAQALACALRDWGNEGATGERPVYLIAGLLQSKDSAGFFAPFVGVAKAAVTVAIPETENSFGATALAAAATAEGLTAFPAESLQDAMRRARELASREKSAPIILIAGSLYLAGAVLAENG